MDKLEEQLASLLEKALEAAEKTGEFVIDLAPELLQEFYMWHIVKHSLGVILFLIGLLISYKVIKKGIEGYKKDENNLDNFVPAYIFGAFIGSLSFGFLCVQIYYLAFILVAPKLYLIEYLLN